MNTESRTIFIGDVHGCYNELKLLLKKVKIHNNDVIYFVGDIINKGPESYKVLNFIYKNKGQFKCIKGNNEVNFLRRIEGIKHGNHKKYINHNIFNEIKHKIETKKTKYLLKYLIDMPIYIETNDFLLIHGGLIPGKNISEHTVDEITRIREYKGTLWYKQYKGDKKVIYGHNAIDGLQIRKRTIGIDSGCVYGKALTAYILETGEIYSQNALNIYENIFDKNLSFYQKIKNIFKLK